MLHVFVRVLCIQFDLGAFIRDPVSSVLNLFPFASCHPCAEGSIGEMVRCHCLALFNLLPLLLSHMRQRVGRQDGLLVVVLVSRYWFHRAVVFFGSGILLRVLS